MTAPAPEKAAPIPAEVWTAAKKALRLADKRDRHEDFARRVTYIARAIMQDHAARASQEERIREDEREACAKIAEQRTANGGTVVNGDAIAQRIRLRGGAS